MKLRTVLILCVLSALISIRAAAQSPVCFDTTLSATGRVLLKLPGGSTELSRFTGANFSYRTTGSPATLSITIEGGNALAAAQTPFTKIAAVTNTAGADMGKANGPFRFWYANLATLTGGTSPTVVVTSCFQPNALISLTGSSGVVTGSGTSGQVAKFTAPNTLGDSQITDDGTNVGIAATGVFTNTQMNFRFKVLLNGLDPATEYTASQGANSDTEAITAGVLVGAGSTVWGVSAVAGYVQTSSATTHAVGVLGQSRCIANSTKCYGINPTVQSEAGLTGVELVGSEIDVNSRNATDAGSALLINSAIITGTIAGIHIAKPTTGIFSAGLVIDTGSSVAGIDIAQAATGNNQASMNIVLNGKDAGGVNRLAYINAQPTGALLLQPAAGNPIIANDILVLNGSTSTSGAASGDIVSYNALGLRSDTAAHNATFALIEGNASNQVAIDPGGQGAVFGANATIGSRLQLGTVHFANRGAVVVGQTFYCDDCDPSTASGIANECTSAGTKTGAIAYGTGTKWACLSVN